MRSSVVVALLLAGCTCDIHIDTGAALSWLPKAAPQKPVAPPPPPTYVETDSYLNDAAAATRAREHGWQIMSATADENGTRYRLRRYIVAEQPATGAR